MMQMCVRCQSSYNPRGRSVSTGDKALMGTCAGLCNTCIAANYREQSLVMSHRARAKKFGLTATLTIKEWIITLDYFEWKCAYCLARPSTTLEHFIPIALEGGTTADNCIPSCSNCHAGKMDKHPYTLLHIPQTDIRRVASYLKTRAKNT
jgi:hypothetical protein